MSQIDHFAQGAHDKRSSPGRDCIPVTPDDDAVLSKVAKALRVFNTSNQDKAVAFRTPDSGVVARIWTVAPGQTIIPVNVTRVMATGTDVGDLEIHAIVD